MTDPFAPIGRTTKREVVNENFEKPTLHCRACGANIERSALTSDGVWVHSDEAYTAGLTIGGKFVDHDEIQYDHPAEPDFIETRVIE